MGENECLGWFPRYNAGQPTPNAVFRAEEELDRIKKEALLEANAHRPPFELPTWTAKYEDGRWYAVNSVTGEEELIVNQEDFDKVFPKQCVTQVCSNDEFKSLSEKTAKAFEKSCNDYLETLSEVSKSLNPCLERIIEHLGKTSKRKARKHYKPKFTL